MKSKIYGKIKNVEEEMLKLHYFSLFSYWYTTKEMSDAENNTQTYKQKQITFINILIQ